MNKAKGYLLTDTDRVFKKLINKTLGLMEISLKSKGVPPEDWEQIRAIYLDLVNGYKRELVDAIERKYKVGLEGTHEHLFNR